MKWKNKNVLVTGAEGMIGKELVKQLKELDCEIYTSDIKNSHLADLRFYNNCINKLNLSNIDYVFHLAGIKGNPTMTKERPADFILPMLQFDSNMIGAAQECGIKKFLYTSSIAVENPATDKYPAWAKMTGETLIEAMRVQYPQGTKYCIVRPANVYGKENLSRKNLMVVSSFIKQGKENGEIVLDIDGAEQIRDIIHASDVARNMIKVMEEMPEYPVNLCSGVGVKIKDIATIIADEMEIPIIYKGMNLILGEEIRVMKQNYDLDIKINLKDGIKECLK